jgi:hypothetical protein
LAFLNTWDEVMKSQLLCACALLALCCVPSFGQTSDNLQAKYGAPTGDTYRVRPGVLMRVKYADDRRVCDMVLANEAPPSDGEWNVLLSEGLAKELVDELVSAGERGGKSKFYGLTLWTGQEGQTNYNYENVSIHYFIRKKMLFVEWQNRGCKRE